MAFHTYNPEGQKKYTQSSEPFLIGVPKDKLFTQPKDRDSSTVIRILPPWSAEGAWARGTTLHWGIGPQKRVLVCPNTETRNSCPYCELFWKIRTNKLYETTDLPVIRPIQRYYANIDHIENPVPTVFVYSFGIMLYKQIDKILETGDFGDITHPEMGHNLRLTRTVQGKRISDTAAALPNPTHVREGLEAQMFNLDGILPAVDAAAVQEAFENQPWKVYNPNENVVVQVPQDLRSSIRSQPVVDATIADLGDQTSSVSSNVQTVTDIPKTMTMQSDPALIKSKMDQFLDLKAKIEANKVRV